MKNFILFTCLLFLYTSSFCQEGIHFEPLTFEQAKAKAKAEKKTNIYGLLHFVVRSM